MSDLETFFEEVGKTRKARGNELCLPLEEQTLVVLALRCLHLILGIEFNNGGVHHIDACRLLPLT